MSELKIDYRPIYIAKTRDFLGAVAIDYGTIYDAALSLECFANVHAQEQIVLYDEDPLALINM